MKRWIAALICLISLTAMGQGLWRNFFTTNHAPVNEVVAGSNAFVHLTLVGTDTRRYTVDVPMSGTATNVYQSEAGTNIIIVTNGLLYIISVDPAITNGLATSNSVYVASNSLAVYALGISNNVVAVLNYATGVSNNVVAVQAYATGVSNNVVAAIGYITGVSNAMITASNALEAYITGVSNNVVGAIDYTTGVSNNVVGAIAYTTGVSNNVVAVLGYATGVSNNVVAVLGYATGVSNLVVGVQDFATGVSNNVNGAIEYTTGVSNLLVGSYLPLVGGTVSGAVTTTSATTNGPANDEFVTGGWVRGLFNVGANYYTSTNIDAVATNLDQLDQPVYSFQSTIPLSASRSYATTDFLTNSGYLGAVITTNQFLSLGGQITINAYLGFTGGASTPALTLHGEIYYSYDRTNWLGDYTSGNQNIVHGTTNLYQWVIDFPTTTSTNASGFWIERRLKVGAVTGTGTRTLTVLIGTNSISGPNDASHIAMQSPSATAGNAYLAADQTFTGSNAFTGTVTSINGRGGTNFYGGTNAIGGTSANNASIITSNNMVQFRNITGNGTNIFYIDPATGALLWNGSHDIGKDASSGSPANIYAGSTLKSRGSLSATYAITGGAAYTIAWNGRSQMSSKDDGSWRVSTSLNKDRIFVNGPVQQLTSTTATGLFTIGARTNYFCSGVIDYTIFCQDAALESQVLSGIVTYAAVNTNGVWTTPVVTEVVANQAKCVTSGTLTTVWDGAAASSGGTTNLTISVTPTTSLTPAANSFYILWQIRNNGTNAVTAL